MGGSDAATKLRGIDAAILAGGLGTRVARSLGDLPKAMAPAGGRPFLDHLLDWLYAQGVRRVVLCLGYGAGAILAHLENYPCRDLEIVCAVEPEPLGTAGGIAYARHLLTGDAALVLNGDTLVDVDLGALVAAYRTDKWDAAIVCARVAGSRYGRVEIDAADRIGRFREKDASDAGVGWINAGVYLFGRAMLDRIAALGRGSLEHDVLERQPPGSIGAFRTEGRFIDIGTPETLAAIRDGIAAFSGAEELRP
jgi:NDP-sugar pyrophosphorylase family protein